MSRIHRHGLSIGALIGVALALSVSIACRREPPATGQTGVEKPVAMRTVAVPVDGMICQVCAGTVKSALKKVPGVQNAEISLENRNAIISYDAGRVTPDQLTRAIKDAGYKTGTPTVTQSP